MLRRLFPSTKGKGHYTSNNLLTHLFHLTFQKSFLVLNTCKQSNKEKKLRYWWFLGVNASEFRENQQRSTAQRKKLFRKADKCADSEAPWQWAGSRLGQRSWRKPAREACYRSLHLIAVSCGPKRPTLLPQQPKNHRFRAFVFVRNCVPTLSLLWWFKDGREERRKGKEGIQEGREIYHPRK